MPFSESMGPFFRFAWERKTRIHGEPHLSSMRYVSFLCIGVHGYFYILCVCPVSFEVLSRFTELFNLFFIQLFSIRQDIYDAKVAVDHLSGFNVGGRYLVVLYYQPAKFEKRAQLEEKEKDLQELRKRVQHHKSTLGGK
jgi:hypothetical protein